VHQLSNLRNEIFVKIPGLGLSGDELKFNHIGKTTDTEHSPNPLIRQSLDLHARLQFAIDSLEFLNRITSREITVTIVDQKYSFGVSLIWHAMRMLLERIQLTFHENASLESPVLEKSKMPLITWVKFIL
jgi:hypothetical protein